MTTTIDTTDLTNARIELARLAVEMPQVAVRTINSSLTGIKTDMKKLAREDYNFKAAALDSRMSKQTATKANIRGIIRSKGGLIHLTDFTGTRKTNKGITVNIKKSTGSQSIPRAFKAPARISSKEIILRRPGMPRGQTQNLYPRYGPPGSAGKPGSSATIDVFYGPHPEIIYNAPENWARIQKDADDRLTKAMDREIAAEFRRMEGKWQAK